MRRLSESVWGGMLSRSTGDTIRKEDDMINSLDIDGLYDYIKSKYDGKVFYIDKDTFGILNKRNIVVDIIDNVCLFTSYDKNNELDHILLSWSKVKIGMPFFDKLKERFNVQSPNVCRRTITEKDGFCTNKTYIDLIDLFLENMDNMLVKESVWGSMIDRSVGDNARKEEIASYNKYKLYNYLLSNYSENLGIDLDNYHMMDWNHKGELKDILIDVNDNMSIYVLYNRTKQLDRIVLINRRGKYDFSILENDFNLSGYKGRFDVSDKDGGVSNYTVINLVKTFAENKDKIVLSESVWGGMLNRSVGDDIRKEDKVPGNFSEIKYVDTGDDNILWSDRNFVVGDQETFERDEIDFPKGYRYPTEKEVDTLTGSWAGCTQKNVDGYIHIKDLTIPQGHYFVTEDGRRIEISKSLAGTSIIFCCAGDIEPKSKRQYKIRLVKEKNMNESVWGGMLNRSIGDSVRKEDDINTLDLHGLCEYLNNIYKSTTPGQDILVQDFEGEGECVVVCLYEDESGYYRYMYYNGSNVITQSDVIETIGCLSEIKEKYTLTSYKNVFGVNEIDIYPKDKVRTPVTNKFFLEVLDFILSKIDAPLSQQIERVNESVWGGMLDRSVGDTKRKEDEIPKDLQEPLASYIDMFASIAFTGEYTVGSYPDFRAFVRDMENSPRISKFDFNIDDLLDYIKSHWDDVVLPTILDTIDKLNNHINVAVDTIIDSLKNPDVNESVWGGMLDRSVGDSVRKEDDLTPDDVRYHMKEFANRIVYYSQYENTFDDYELFSKEKWHFFDDKGKAYTVKQVDYVKRNWDKGAKFRLVIEYFIKEEEEKIKKLGFEREPGKSVDETLDDWWYSVDDKRDFMDDCDEECYTNPDDMWEDRDWEEKIKMYVEDKNYMGESVWGGMLNRSTGDEIRKEDEVLTDMEINSLNEFISMYCRGERAHYIQNHIAPPPPSGRKENDYEGLIKYIEDRRDENLFTNVSDYDKIIRYIKKNWDELDMDMYIKRKISFPRLMVGKKLVECEGVPGGLTPADVGGMGAAYFPGPNGEPGSGDLPSPTGIVYHQVAPYTMFLKQTKKKKKKTKKFRKEDEPCVHSPNAKVYDYVDDFREYVDRTYNNIDKRK